MTYDTVESSLRGSKPRELYRFFSNGMEYNFTSWDKDVVLNSTTYEAISISRDGVEASQDYTRATIDITMDLRHEFAQKYISNSFMDIIYCEIIRVQTETGTDTTLVSTVIWKGRVVNFKYTTEECVITTESINTIMARPTNRRYYQILCPYVLYSSGSCNVVKQNFKVDKVVTLINGKDLFFGGLGGNGDLSTYPDDYFVGGFFEYNSPYGFVDRRFIQSQTYNSVHINLLTVGLNNNMQISLYPGCNRSMQCCNDRFQNILNYGGQPFYPDRNPINSQASIF